MSAVLPIIAIFIGGFFALWVVLVVVYLVGAKMTALMKAYEEVDDNRAAILGWGVLYVPAWLLVLFLLVRFVKFAWTVE